MNKQKHIHFIAIGGAAMHSLALALQTKGYKVSGSDDEIFEPSRSRLQKAGLLPEPFGWHPENITNDIDTVILGMHAKPNNPELCKALDMGLHVVSYPEFLYAETRNKQRVVIAGSHGKTTITAMVMHVLQNCGKKFDYMVGSALEGVDNMVSLRADTDLAVFEGDEYLSSPIDMRSKFFHYHPDILVINGISWDHMNVFPTFGSYKQPFEQLADELPPSAKVFYFDDGAEVSKVGCRAKCFHQGYTVHKSETIDGQVSLIDSKGYRHPICFFGKHNLQNVSAALKVCTAVNVSEDDFYAAIKSFKGTRKRLQLIAHSDTTKVYLDFAHAPSKVKATVEAVREQYPSHRLVACFELHTFSSLNSEFLQHYSNTLNAADEALVFYNPEVLHLKGLPPIHPSDIQTAFSKDGLIVASEKKALENELEQIKTDLPTIYLLMSSGNFGGIDIEQISCYLATKR